MCYPFSLCHVSFSFLLAATSAVSIDTQITNAIILQIVHSFFLFIPLSVYSGSFCMFISIGSLFFHLWIPYEQFQPSVHSLLSLILSYLEQLSPSLTHFTCIEWHCCCKIARICISFNLHPPEKSGLWIKLYLTFQL